MRSVFCPRRPWIGRTPTRPGARPTPIFSDPPGRTRHEAEAMRTLFIIALAGGLIGSTLACAREQDAPTDHAVQVRTARAASGTITEWIRLYGQIGRASCRERV